MIDLILFREYCADLKSKVNERTDVKVDSLFFGVKEEHLVSKLKDASGICMCVSYPDAEADGVPDCESDIQQVIFFIVEKISPADQTADEELEHYARLQHLMLTLRTVIRETVSTCMKLLPEESYRIEFEYRIFGGYNGLSMNVKFKDYD